MENAEALQVVLRHSNDTMVETLFSLIEHRSMESEQHTLRIRRYTKLLLEQVAESCPEYGLTEDAISMIASAAALHDVGKIEIPDDVLMKPGALTPDEWEVIKTHTTIGGGILEGLAEIGNREYLAYARTICLYHHERFDGKGYPEGLAGEEIPICAQVVGLTDAFDALTSQRVYKDAYDLQTAASMIEAGECGAFSPKLLTCFRKALPQFEQAHREYASGLSPKEEKFDIPYDNQPSLLEKEQENRLMRKRLEQYEIILAQTENVLFDWNVKNDTVSYSDNWEKIFGFKPVTRSLINVLAEIAWFHPDDRHHFFDRIRALGKDSDFEKIEVRMQTSEGIYLWCRIRASAIRDQNGELDRIVGVIINIDAEKQAEQALQERAERDALTKLLNKDAGRKRVEAHLGQQSQGAECALLIIDLDYFKEVNDRYGHLFGDSVLTRVAKEIQKLFRAQDIIARIGGDEFMVLMQGISDRELVEKRCEQLENALRMMFQQENQLPISCSIGIALSPEHGTTYQSLFQKADLALYQVKDQGRNGHAIYREDEQTMGTRAARITAVSSRIDSNEQPGAADSKLVQYAFQKLYTSQDVDASIDQLLALVGKQTNVSRVYVFENSPDNRYCSNTFEWCNGGIVPEKDNLQNISYETDIPGFEQNFNENDIFYCPDIEELPRNLYEILAPQGIKSILHCAIRDNGVFRGYIGFDDCVSNRYWTKDQIDLLAYFSEMLSLFLLKMRAQERINRHAENLISILDNQNAWIYVVDPKTCELKYLNAKARLLTPMAKEGMRCYEVLRCQKSQCEGCPMAMAGRRGTATMPGLNEMTGQTQVEAIPICWDGQDACLITCREV